METILIIFMVFAGIICLGTTTLIVVEIVGKIKASKKANEPAQNPTVATTAPQAEVATQIAVVEEVSAQQPEQTQETDENGVWISAGQSQTLEEKYLDLSAEQKGWYDEIERYAMTKEGIKHFKNAKYEDYKLGKHRIVRLTIKRGVVQCEFVLLNQDFRNYINDNKVSIKTASTIIKIESAEALQAAKNSVDIAIKAVEEERLYKKQQQKEKRRKARENAEQQ